MGLTTTWLELYFENINYTFIIYKVNRKIRGDFPLFSISFKVNLILFEERLHQEGSICLRLR
jgi:hypothetical protein